MADLSTLRATVTKATPIEDQTTYKYHISVAFGGQAWEVTKRFSDFDSLLQVLGNNKYAGLPRLPAKTLLGSPTDEVAIAGRKEQLRIILQDLLSRPDTRTSHQVRAFLAFDSHCSEAQRSLLPEALRTFEDPRFGVSGLCASPESNVLLVTHEDSTHLSRLGRVWSVVEPDELGALHLWSEATGGGWKRVYSYTYGIKVRSLAWEDITRQFFVGLEDGKIEAYAVEQGTLKVKKMAALELHHKSPVTFLAASPRRLLSLGFDNAMRTIDVRTHELLCGGRLMKRLKNESDYLTCGYLDDMQERAFIGTSGGDVFILDISKNPPNFLHTLDLSATHISMMCMCPDRMLFACGDSVTAMRLADKGSEQNITKLGEYRAKHLQSDEVTILSVTAAPERHWIFGGFSDGAVAVWSYAHMEVMLVVQAHQSDVTKLVWIPLDPWGPSLFTGGGDGKVTTWVFNGREEEYVIWNPQGMYSTDPNDPFSIPLVGAGFSPAQASLAVADTLTVFEPTFEGGSGFTQGVRINPQAVRNADDSDSDNDIVGAFR